MDTSGLWNELNHERKDPRLHRIVSVQFWKRCDNLQPGNWLIKGADALALRAGAARSTLDLDLLTVGDPGEDPVQDVRELLYEAAALRLQDGFEFKVRKTEPLRESNTYRARLEVKLDGKKVTSEHNVDLGYRTRATALLYIPRISAEFITPLPIAGVTMPVVALYPLVQHVADKVCATFEMTNGRESDRFHDLFDLVWIARSFSFVRSELTAAVLAEAVRRDITIPVPFTPPSEDWRNGFAVRVRDEPNLTNGWPDYDRCVDLVNKFLNASAHGPTKIWRPATLTWT